MPTYDSSSDAAQRRIIDKLNNELKKQGRLITYAENRYAENEKYRIFWEDLYELMAENEIVKDQFLRLMTTVSLCSEQKIPGLTHPADSAEFQQLDFFDDYDPLFPLPLSGSIPAPPRFRSK